MKIDLSEFLIEIERVVYEAVKRAIIETREDEKLITVPPKEDIKDYPSLMYVKEAAEYLRMSVGSIYNKVSNRTIPFTKIDGRLRFRKADLYKYIEDSSFEY